MLLETNFADYRITINPTFETIYIYLHSVLGFIAITLSCLVIYLVIFKSNFLGKEYMYCLLTLKIFSLLFDVNSVIIFLPFVILPCKGMYSMGIGPLIGISAHGGLVICNTLMSGICTWFNCCLFHRHQIIMPYDSKIKLSERKGVLVYFIMNFVLFVNPFVLIFSSADDAEEQRPFIENSTMYWLLEKPSYKIFTDDNTPAMMRFHFPYLMFTFLLCTVTTTVLTSQSVRVMKSRKDTLSAATIAMQEKLIRNLSIQMNVQSLGIGGPVIFWILCLFANLITSEATVAVYLFLLITSIVNSVYLIVSTRKYRKIVLQYCRCVFGGLKERTAESPRQVPQASVVSQQFTGILSRLH